jgi:hypothetical protein
MFIELIPSVRFHKLMKLSSLTVIKAPKYGDTSATYWKLYAAEAEINDTNLVESLMGNTNSMVLLVRGDAHC